MFEKIWDTEVIAEYICELHAKGVPIYSSYIHEHYQTLHRAAFRYFGNWEAAVTAAGFDYDQIRRTRRWTKEKIVAGIKAAYKAGDDLSWRVVSKSKHSSLASAAICDRHFGSWKAALEAAGIKESEFRRYNRWSDEKVRQRILSDYRKGNDLNAKAMESACPKFYHAAVRRFGCWRKAVESCGLDYRHIAMRVSMTKEEVLAILGKLQKQAVHMSSSNVQNNYPAVHATAVRRFGSWSAARKELMGYKVDYRYKRRRSNEEQPDLFSIVGGQPQAGGGSKAS